MDRWRCCPLLKQLRIRQITLSPHLIDLTQIEHLLIWIVRIIDLKVEKENISKRVHEIVKVSLFSKYLRMLVPRGLLLIASFGTDRSVT